MPIYEYGCESCQKIHEVMQKFSDEPLTTCPDCGALVRKLMSRSGFALKGSGWYTTDYKSPAKSAASKPATETPAAPAPTSAPKPAGEKS